MTKLIGDVLPLWLWAQLALTFLVMLTSLQPLKPIWPKHRRRQWAK